MNQFTKYYYQTWAMQNDAPVFNVYESFKDGYIDPCGHQIIDMTSTSYQASFGHRPKIILDKIKEQLEKLPMASPKANFDLKNRVSERLVKKMEFHKGKIFYTVSGAESVENALKIARNFTKKEVIACRQNSYHGATLGAVSVTGDWRNQKVQTIDQWSLRIPDPLDDHDGNKAMVKMKEFGTEKIAGLILETITGNNGVWSPSPLWYKNIQSFCKSQKILLILDEVICAFGRTGPDFGFLHYEDLRPDIICMAKGISGGIIPFGAVYTNEEISRFYQKNIFPCGLTNYAHPLGLAALDGVLHILDSASFKNNKLKLEKVFSETLDQFKSLAGVCDIRRRGLLCAIDFDDNFSLPSWNAFIDAGVYLIITPFRIILAPALTMEPQNLKNGLKIIEETIWKKK